MKFKSLNLVMPTSRLTNKLKIKLIAIAILLFFPFVTAFAIKPPENMADYSALKGQSFTVSRMGKDQETWSKAVELELIDITEAMRDKDDRNRAIHPPFSKPLKRKKLWRKPSIVLNMQPPDRLLCSWNPQAWTKNTDITKLFLTY